MTSSACHFRLHDLPFKPEIPIEHHFSVPISLWRLIQKLTTVHPNPPKYGHMLTSQWWRHPHLHFRYSRRHIRPIHSYGKRFSLSCSGSRQPITEIYTSLEPAEIWASTHTILMMSSACHFQLHDSPFKPEIPIENHFSVPISLWRLI